MACKCMGNAAAWSQLLQRPALRPSWVPLAKPRKHAAPTPLLAARTMLELQQALDACGAAAAEAPRFDTPAFELHGSFDNLVQQLQECVDWRRKGEAATEMARLACWADTAACVLHSELFPGK